MRRVLLVVFTVLAVGAGCGSRCREVEDARTALRQRTGAQGRTADLRVTVPFARANEVIAASLALQPLAVPLKLPEIPARVVVPALSLAVRDVQVLPAAEGKVRFAVTISIRDEQAEVATLGSTVEVEPRFARSDVELAPPSEGHSYHSVLSIALGADSIAAIAPELGPDARRSLADAVERWLPASAKGKVPRPLLELAAGSLAEELTKGSFEVLQRTLLPRLGEVTSLKLQLPDMPVKRVVVHSTQAALIVEMVTDLPVRAGLVPATQDASEIRVELAASAVAELANWAIDEGHAPRWYDRSLHPRAHGEYRPRFDYIAEDRAHPFKVSLFQERGGCSYFRVGAQTTLATRGDELEVRVTDRVLERRVANPVVEVAAAVKYFLTGSLDRSKRIAAHTRLVVGGRALETRLIGAALAHDAVAFTLRVEATPTRSSSRGTR